jgi:hypothetical protein
MSQRRPRPMARSPRIGRRSRALKAGFALLLSSFALTAAAPAPAAPLGLTATSPTVRGPFVYPAVRPLVFEGSLRSLPIAQPGPSQALPIGFPMPSQPLMSGGGSVRPTKTAAAGGPTGRRSPAIDFSNVYPNFNGAFDLCCPADPNGDVGPNHYIQMVNSSFQIFDKAGTSLAGPSRISTIWTGAGDTTSDCARNNSGDPIVKYDRQANRWLISQFAIPNGLFNPPSSECIAISRTADPVNGGWFIYTFRIPGDRIDYPKFGVWPDAYYMSSQQGYSGGSLDAWAFDRANMLNGMFVTPVRFTVAGPALILLPADLDGATPPPMGAPAPFARAIDGTLWGGGDRVEVFDFHVDWNNPGLSTFTPNVTLPTTFDANMCSGQNLFNNCVPQPGTATLLETLTNWSMQPLQYRNFGTRDTLVFTHSVDENGSDHAGVRWYELRRATPGMGAWTMFQGATHAPNAVHRWMGSTALNGAGDMAVSYSTSDGTSVFPGIRYAGRLSTDPLNTLPQGEFTIVNGASSSGATRWGDYSAMAVDPVDDCTFWYTAEYMSAAGRRTRIGAFKFPSCVRTISINNVALDEGNVGTTMFTFTVSLSAPTGVVTTVNWATADGSATTADGDYNAASGTVTFASGDTSETVTVLVNGDIKIEPNENFFVNLSNAMGADIADGQGEGTILNDDLSADVDCTITGTNRDDVLVGTPGNDVICGRAGDDMIFGAGGHDVLFGDPGRDQLFGEAGNDLLLGGPGQDALDGGAGNDNLQGEQGKDDLTGGNGSDALFGGNSPDSLDTLDGVAGNDSADGGSGPDTCVTDPGDIVIDCP